MRTHRVQQAETLQAEANVDPTESSEQASPMLHSVPKRPHARWAGAAGVVVLVGAGVAAIVASQSAPERSHESQSRQAVSAQAPAVASDVPTSILDGGVQIGGSGWLLTPSPDAGMMSSSTTTGSPGSLQPQLSLKKLISADQAVADATQVSGHNLNALEKSAQVELVTFTIPGVAQDFGLNANGNPDVWIVTLPITPMQMPDPGESMFWHKSSSATVPTCGSLGLTGARCDAFEKLESPTTTAATGTRMISHINFAVDAVSGKVLSTAYTP